MFPQQKAIELHILSFSVKVHNVLIVLRLDQLCKHIFMIMKTQKSVGNPQSINK